MRDASRPARDRIPPPNGVLPGLKEAVPAGCGMEGN